MSEQEWLDRDFYADLGVSQQASAEEIKQAYRRLARQNHPDAQPNDTGAEETFKRVSEAYSVLSDPDKRAQYDQTRQLAGAGVHSGSGARSAAGGFGPRGPTGGAATRGADLGDLFGFTPGGMGTGDAQSLFDSLFGTGPTAGTGRSSTPPRGADLEAELTLDFRTAARGGTLPLQLTDESGTRTQQVRIPAGITDGQRLRLRGQGQPLGPHGRPGDLYVRLHITPDAVFARTGDDLTLTLPVTLPELVFGAAVTVPTLEGTVSLRIPADSHPGRTLRVRNRGITRPNGRRGNLLVTLQPALPEHHNDAASQALRTYAEATADFDPRAELGQHTA